MNVVRGFLSIFSAKIGELVLGILITPILVRILTDAQYGEYVTVLSIIGIIMIFVDAGLFNGVRKFISEDQREENWMGDVFSFYAKFAIALSLVIAGGILLLTRAGVATRLYGPEFTRYFYLVSAFVVAQQLFVLARATLMGLGAEAYSEPLRVLRTFGRGALGIPLAYMGYGVAGVLAGQIVASLVAAGIGFRLLARRLDVGRMVRSTPDYLPTRDLLSFNTLSIALSVFMLSLYHVDVLMIQFFKGSAVTAHYKAALVVAEFLWFAPQAVSGTFLQSISRLWSQGKAETVMRVTSRTTRYTALFTLLLALGLAALAKPFIQLYFGETYVVAAKPLLVLLPGAVGFAIAKPILTVSEARGNLRPLIAATSVAAILNAALNAALIPTYGMMGAAFATSVGYGAMLVGHVFSARAVGFDPLADLRGWRIAATTAVAAVVIFGLSSLIESDLVSLAVIPPVGFVVFTATALRVGAFEVNELSPFFDEFAAALGRIHPRFQSD